MKENSLDLRLQSNKERQKRERQEKIRSIYELLTVQEHFLA